MCLYLWSLKRATHLALQPSTTPKPQTEVCELLLSIALAEESMV